MEQVEDGSSQEQNDRWVKTLKRDIVTNHLIFDFKKIFYMSQSKPVQAKMRRVLATLDRFSSTHNLKRLHTPGALCQEQLRECLVANFRKMDKESR